MLFIVRTASGFAPKLAAMPATVSPSRTT